MIFSNSILPNIVYWHNCVNITNYNPILSIMYLFSSLIPLLYNQYSIFIYIIKIDIANFINQYMFPGFINIDRKIW